MAYNPLNPNSQATMANSQPVVIASNQTPVSVTGTVNIGNLSTNQSVSGTIGASVLGSVPVTMAGAWTTSVVGTVFVGGSVAVVGSSANQSVSGTINVGNFPTTQNVSGSVAAFQGTNPWIITGSVQGSFTPSGNQSVSGTVGASVIGTVPVTMAGAWTASVVGTVFIGGSVATVTVNQSVSGTVGASIIGAVPVTQSGGWVTSVSGFYAAASAVVASSPGVYNLGARNDTLASVLGGNGTYAPLTIGPVGEVVTANAPISQWVQGNASVFTGVIQPVIAAQGASVFTYITGIQIANASANNGYLTFYGATSSVIGYSVVPANGGSNIVIPNAWKTNANGGFSASVSGVSSVFLSASGFNSRT